MTELNANVEATQEVGAVQMDEESQMGACLQGVLDVIVPVEEVEVEVEEVVMEMMEVEEVVILVLVNQAKGELEEENQEVMVENP